ncbi:MAG: hypothetical protein BMS9Abin15_0645 [Gammaproteobacteria bacterium]|nr:MAG: hypothetical protein BMS9Abin15_0645 [Gammaproteobacteria bacterium]
MALYYIAMVASAVRIKVKVLPKTSRSCLAGWLGDTLKVCVHAAPEKGKANGELKRVFADVLQIRVSNIQIIAGMTSQRKIIEIHSMDACVIDRHLKAAINNS